MKTYENYVQTWKDAVVHYYDKVGMQFEHFERFNHYFYKYRRNLLKKFIPKDSIVLDLGCGTGDNLFALQPKKGLGIDSCPRMIEIAKKQFNNLSFQCMDADEIEQTNEQWDYIVAVNLFLEVPDIFRTLTLIKRNLSTHSRLVILNHSAPWEFFFRLYTYLQYREHRIRQNWLNWRDYENLFLNSGLTVVKKTKAMLFPFNIPLLSSLINRFSEMIPLIRSLGMLEIYVLAPQTRGNLETEYSCSVIIPCKNEEKNIPEITSRIVPMGKFTEIIFVDDQSDDNTYQEMLKEKERCPKARIKIIKGPGLGKGAACREGFKKAKGDILMILDADMTVAPEVLPDFYKILQEGHAEFVNGSRQIYSLEDDSMRFANRIGNAVFAWLFSRLMGFRVNDTLCGTKVFFRRDLQRILETREFLGGHDVWGDFDLLFGASRHNLIYTEHPVHYFPRNHGETKMGKRLKNAFIMFRHWINAFKKFHL